jgi:hypothetical protein
MTTHVLKGSKREIADHLVRLTGEVREAIVFVDEPTPPAAAGHPAEVEDPFAEMTSSMVDVADVDDSRVAIYSRADGE